MEEIDVKKFEAAIKNKAKSRDMYKIVFTTTDGKDIEYEILATFRNTKTKKIYYIMTDNTRDHDNKLNISFFYIIYEGDGIEIEEMDNDFYPVVDDDEIKMVMEVFDKIKADL